MEPMRPAAANTPMALERRVVGNDSLDRQSSCVCEGEGGGTQQPGSHAHTPSSGLSTTGTSHRNQRTHRVPAKDGHRIQERHQDHQQHWFVNQSKRHGEHPRGNHAQGQHPLSGYTAHSTTVTVTVTATVPPGESSSATHTRAATTRRSWSTGSTHHGVGGARDRR